jgi:hypothetical protein
MEQQAGSETYSSTKLTETKPKETYGSVSEPDVIPGVDSTPWLDSMEPDTVTVPGPDTTVTFTGGNFASGMELIWNEALEPVTGIDSQHASTVVKPSTVEAELPFTVPVYVRNGRGLESNRLSFTFVAEEVIP